MPRRGGSEEGKHKVVAASGVRAVGHPDPVQIERATANRGSRGSLRLCGQRLRCCPGMIREGTSGCAAVLCGGLGARVHHMRNSQWIPLGESTTGRPRPWGCFVVPRPGPHAHPKVRTFVATHKLATTSIGGQVGLAGVTRTQARKDAPGDGEERTRDHL